MKTWITSDHHFNHANILTFKDDEGNLIRPGFTDVQHMNEYMIKMWNKYIQPGDKVYHLGDAIMSESATAIGNIMRQLNGTKVLIRGNHDNAKLSIYAQYFKDVRATHTLRDRNGGRYVLSHFPIHESSLTNVVNLHGHTHQRELGHPYVNMCVEITNYMPIDFDSFNGFLVFKGDKIW